MQRKAIQLAEKTLVISLPSKWVKRYGVKKGSSLFVEERGQQLTVETKSTSKSESVSIDASSMNPKVLERWVLSSFHKSGYDEIEIKGNQKIFASVQRVMGMLMGFAIVEQSKDSVVIRSIAKEQEQEFETLLRRAFLVTLNMGERMVELIEAGEYGELADLVSLEQSNNQLTNICERILNKKGFSDDKKTAFVYVICWNLEKVADHFKELCLYLQDKKVSSSTLSLLHDAVAYLRSFYEAYYQFSLDKMSKLHEERAAFLRKYELQLGKGSKADEFVRSSLKEFVIKVSDFSASFIAVRLKTS